MWKRWIFEPHVQNKICHLIFFVWAFWNLMNFLIIISIYSKISSRKVKVGIWEPYCLSLFGFTEQSFFLSHLKIPTHVCVCVLSSGLKSFRDKFICFKSFLSFNILFISFLGNCFGNQFVHPFFFYITIGSPHSFLCIL